MAQKRSTLDHWEKFWQDKQQIEQVYSNEDRIYQNLNRVTGFDGKKILEVGAGSGRDSFQLARKNAIVYVLDYSPRALEIIKKLDEQQGVSLILIQSDALHLPFANETLDIVFHQGLMEHFAEPGPLLSEQFRVLKPGGLLLVDVPQRYHIYTLIKHVLILLNRWFAGWETQFSIGQLKRIVQQAGFTVVHQYGRWMRPSLFYRMSRELLKKLGLQLPLYPPGIPLFRQLRQRLSQVLAQQSWAFYTFLDIGVIAQKPSAERRWNASANGNGNQ
ncbi:MAG: methyltransferase domain-containing protein [candidate division KSB1 bacterium]|nr:methyltransferase domain-containing protein [candidate division KSB1 bacterium]MDZ7335694.1 methyltransferase domain-containing protein [candidate division KSB1 bacterium]MDZ7358354.1 methyltransferase domain-containing protein [candidate division KSB1 bacterium]MDZ7401961.1 methyltransferase domain-containing protein [candidate division KSB1 bacterium]